MRRLIPLGLIIYYFFFIAAFLAMGRQWERTKMPPEQPIAFSHKIHVSRVGLQCDYCHRFAGKAAAAGVPSVAKCMSCHKAVAVDRPEVKKIHEYWEKKEPIPWIRVHRIHKRKYVYFTHKRHIKAGVDCSNCHGDVGVMSRVRRVKSLEMGWCVTCHKSRSAPVDCLTCHK